MSEFVTYNFYGTTIPVLSSIAASAASILRAAKEEQSKGSLPSDQEILDSKVGDMLPFRMQPMILAKFSVAPIASLNLSKAEVPALRIDFKTLDEVIELFDSLKKFYDSVDEKAFNEAASKSTDIPISTASLHVTAVADHFHSFVLPNSFFHLNAIYFLLRSSGFILGKGKYISSFMSAQTDNDWKPIRG